MRTKIIIIVFLFSFLYSSGSDSRSTHEAEALIQRVLDRNTHAFILQQIPEENEKDVYEVEGSKNGRIILRGNNGVSLATAFNCYLKEIIHVSYDWQANKPVKIAGKLPVPSIKIHRFCHVKERFFNNPRTFGYTFVYWNWEQWQRFIDWMAMNGINRPLMLAGQEAVWLNVWKSFGMSNSEALISFTAPAQLPWHRMGNLDKWGGPLPISYIEGQQILQQQILNRCRALDMKPILSAFAGHVPCNLQKLFPLAKIKKTSPTWGDLDIEYTTCFLEPTDTLFTEIQNRFLFEQKKLYGTDHLYLADPFNGITLPSYEPDYLREVSNTIYDSMSSIDGEAIWYQMSSTYFNDTTHWTKPRITAIIQGISKGKLIFLDDACEGNEDFRKSNNFNGAPFIWCYSGNIGGNTNLFAPLDNVSKSIAFAKKLPNCSGVGATPEGINMNPGIYEFVLEIPWRNAGQYDPDIWIRDYALRRAGHNDEAVTEAWRMLKQDVLVDIAAINLNHSIIYQVPPVIDLNSTIRKTDTQISYKNVQLAKALNQMFQADNVSVKSDAFHFDVVNLTRQVLGNYGRELYYNMMHEYEQGNIHGFQRASGNFITLGLEIDSLLATRHEFLLGKWLADARQWGSNETEHEYYEHNAREILTNWHKERSGLIGYSNPQWNGLIRSYYLPRWIEFIKRLDISMRENKQFDAIEFSGWCAGFEQSWVNNSYRDFLVYESGDAVGFSHKLFLKYRYEIM